MFFEIAQYYIFLQRQAPASFFTAVWIPAFAGMTDVFKETQPPFSTRVTPAQAGVHTLSPQNQLFASF
jgi:hypothetical protein